MGKVKYNELTLELTQTPYIDQRNGIDAYFASAEDEEDNEYEVRWSITDEDCEDEGDACDWDDYKVRKL